MGDVRNEILARDALLDYLNAESGLNWKARDEKPDNVVRDRASYDFDLYDDSRAEAAALEISVFDWPQTRTTNAARLRSLAENLQADLAGSLTGSYSLGADMNLHKSRPANAEAIRAWIVERASLMPIGELVRVQGAPGVNIMKLSDDGPFEISLMATSASIDYSKWIGELEDFMVANGSKFDGVTVPRWLLVIYLGVSHKLKLTGPILSIPETIDEVFFIDRWPPDAASIIDYRRILAAEFPFNRASGTITVPHSALRPVARRI